MAEFRIYRTELGSLQWFLMGDSGRKVAQSGEMFDSLDACEASIDAVRIDAPNAEIVDRSDTEPIEHTQERAIGAVARRSQP